MELWIRSQDKERLMKVNYIYLFSDEEIEQNDELRLYSYIDFFSDEEIKQNDEFRLYSYIDNTTQYLLGTYETKERALEVLDEIFKIINNASSQYNEVFPTSAVYQMPKE